MKLNAVTAIRAIKTTFARRSPEILLGVGLAGLITAPIMAIKATPKVMDILEKEKEKKGEELTLGEKVKHSWKCYIPTIGIVVVSAACVIGGHNVNVRRNAALATMYSMSEQALQEWQEKTKEEVGDRKTEQILSKINQDSLKEHPVSTEGVEVEMFNGMNQLCYDCMSGKYFMSDKNFIENLIIKLNNELNAYDAIEVEDWYYGLGFKRIPDLAKGMYWKKKSTTFQIEPSFTSEIADDGRTCLCVSFNFDSRPVDGLNGRY